MRVAIIGSRKWDRPSLVDAFVRRLAEKYPDAVVVSGGAPGADTFAVVAARKYGLRWKEHDPKKDGRITRDTPYYEVCRILKERNQEVVDDSDRLVAFWDGSSTGTKDALDRALRKPIPVTVYGPDGKVRP